MHGDPRSVNIIRKFKNIDLLKNRKKKNIVCVDKSLLPYLNHISNFVPILPFRPSDRSSKRNGPETEGRELKKDIRNSDAKVMISYFLY